MILLAHSLMGLQLIETLKLRTMAAFCSFLLVSKIYNWMRLFERTAFYVQLLYATLESIGWFMLLFFVAMLLFGLPLSLLNLS